MPLPNESILNWLTAAIPVILTILGYIGYALSSWIKAHGTTKQWELISAYGKLTVQALEQMGLTGQIENVGQVKKAEAIKALQAFADAHRIKLNVSDFEMIIEGALREGVHKGWNDYIKVTADAAPTTTQGQ